MPYKRNADLPKGPRALPAGAQTIYRNAYNGAHKGKTTAQASRIAWAAVKRKYRKDGERWVRRR